MSTITSINSGDLITNSRTVINTNFSNLNTDKEEVSNKDIDTTLAANSDVKYPSQKAIKAYVDAKASLTIADNIVGQSGQRNYAVDSGSSDTYVISLSPTPVTGMIAGFSFIFKANTANTGAATLNPNGGGNFPLVKGVNTVLANNDILAGMLCFVVHDGTNFILMNPRAL